MRIWGAYSRLGVITALLTLAADQIHKTWMIAQLESWPDQKITLAPFFDIKMSWNKGVSYGLFKQDTDFGRWLLISFSVLAVLGLFYWLSRIGTTVTALSIGLIMGGALGNAVDRIHYGAVADFFYFHIGPQGWYIFNVADIAIVGGVIGLLYDSFFTGHKKAEKAI